MLTPPPPPLAPPLAPPPAAAERTIGHVVSALRGFFRSITLGAHLEQSLQDLLRLLTLWFRYGGDARVDAALSDGFALVHVDTWLLVIPQIIARINAPQPRVRKAVQNLLLTVGRLHPQALIYPLAVASHESRPRREAERSTAASPRPDGRQAAAATSLPLFSMGRTSPRRGDAWRCPQ